MPMMSWSGGENYYTITSGLQFDAADFESLQMSRLHIMKCPDCVNDLCHQRVAN